MATMKMHTVRCKMALLNSRGPVNKSQHTSRNVKAAFESDKAAEAHKHSKNDGHMEENELLPIHHPGSFPLHGLFHDTYDLFWPYTDTHS